MAAGAPPMVVDLQTIVDTLSSLDEESLVNVLSSVLQARPEVAPPVVNFSIPDLTYPPSRALTERRSQGVIKSFNMSNGFGFIDCPELHAVFGNDVFLHNKQLGEFGPGAMVSFAVCLSKDNKPQAYDLQHMSGKGMMALGPPYEVLMMKGKWGFKGKPDDGKGKRSWQGKSGKSGDMEARKVQTPPGTAPWEELGQFSGTVKSFNPKSGYGFITCVELQDMGFTNDVFLHHQQMGDCNVGMEVTFTCYLNSKGQPQAKEVAPEDSPAVKRQRMG
eukprot:CAMPEP_0179064392 /NCGR_PEP_ID=MMETSP0796-20121207/27926_1 /TAXON_ID=73915 /ORGANISM="Pyrodinium bahamense, Strain pbaha01" /LENGTH=274 /DNA_ID=CAMNT_0020761341 /DNA_START=72 /DNA_END=896 /DNA_ORIENTATION=+